MTSPSHTLLLVCNIFAAYSIGKSIPSPLFHCTKISTVVGGIRRKDADTAEIELTTSARLSLGLDETACFQVNVQRHNASETSLDEEVKDEESDDPLMWFYAIRYANLEQLYPVKQQYIFGIPQLRAKCTCDCPGGVIHCSPGVYLRNCTAKPYCVSTFHAHQHAAGCQNDGEATVCCDVIISPYQQRQYVAVYLGQSVTAASFVLTKFVQQDGKWVPIKDQLIKMIVNQKQIAEYPEERMSFVISGITPHWHLNEGMYFYEQNVSVATLRAGVPVNRQYEWSMNKLGWFRLQHNDKWGIRKGRMKIQATQFVQTKDCQAQLYSDSYNAEFYVQDGTETTTTAAAVGSHVHLGYALQETEKWIKAIDVPLQESKADAERYMVVQLAQSPAIMFDLQLNMSAKLTFHHHTASISDFRAMVVTDRHSNTYINLTMFNVRGTIIGTLYKTNTEKESDLVFSAHVGNKTVQNHSVLLPVQNHINAARWLCMHPYQIPTVKCRWISYESTPLQSVDIPHRWIQQKGDCSDCNLHTTSSFLKYLNPSSWINGINGWTEGLAVGLEVGLYLLTAVVGITIFRRLVLPLLKLALCDFRHKTKALAT